MTLRHFSSSLVVLASLTIASCDRQADVDGGEAQSVSSDPLLARALSDPLMVDPDLASRNEVNAAIAYRDGHPLPPLTAREDAASRAREAVRLELLEGGQIAGMSPASDGPGGSALGGLSDAGAMVKAVGSREDCIDRMDARLGWSDSLPDTSAIMPHGMVQQAAGVDVDTCVIRVVRYLTPVSPQDALEYHFVKVDRARFAIERFDAPEAQLRAERRDQVLTVHVREGPGGLTEVDLVHWRK